MLFRFWGIVAFLFGVDQLTKWLARFALDAGAIDVGFIEFTLVYNMGAAYGILANFTMALTVIGVAVITYLVIQLKQLIVNRVTFFGYAFIMAGAIGNTMDRIMFGKVTDFLNIHIIPVFNVADVCLNIGLGLLILQFVWYEKRRSNHSV